MSGKLIYGAMIAVMREITAISKSRKNQTQNYNFRGIDDVYNELHDIMAEKGVFCLPTILEDHSEERTGKSGGVLIYRILKMKFTFIAEDGSEVECVTIGEGMDSGDKASNKAMSVAQKYALMQTFLIPTEDAKDPENDSHEIIAGNSVQVGQNVVKLFAALKEKNITPELFASFLISSKSLQQGQDIRALKDDKAGYIVANFSKALDAFNVWAEKE
jgi:hypothetical protein